MLEEESVETKYIKTESFRRSYLIDGYNERRPVTATGGFGLRLKVDEEEQRRIQEEDEQYKPYAKRVRTEEENYKYSDEAREIHLEKIKKIRITESTQNIKIEPSCQSDSKEIEFYNRPGLNFFNHSYNTNLPIMKHRNEIISTINENNIIIIQGNTGCGKTTQVPQFIIDDAAKYGRLCKIIVTQPRRIAAKSISKRVCDERNWEHGSVCGFKVSMEKKCSEETRIFYVTTGYLQEMIVADHTELNKYTHIILDEVHDRDLETDLIILLVKLLLIKEYKGKVVLMSATLDPKSFIDYFKPVSLRDTVPVIKCEMNLFEVATFYLDDLEEKVDFETGIVFKTDNPLIFDEQIEIVCRLLRNLDQREAQVQGSETNLARNRGAVLIFVPGWEEINRVEHYISTQLADNKLVFCQLHSQIALEVQMKAFHDTSDYYRKVIISTSIAESSVTVPDVKYVIDFCLTKSPYTDPGTNYTTLELVWASKSNLRQRRGRAGRVQKGICYRLVPKRFYKEAIREFPVPAIIRESLDKLILNVKRMCSDKPREILGLALTPPSLDQIERTVLFLKEAGALSLYKKKRICADDGDITFAGTVMNFLPIDIHLTKLILFGHVFGRLRDAIILAAALSAKSIFIQQPGSYFEFFKGKYFFSGGLKSDFTCIISAYNLWQAHLKYSNMSKRDMEKWCHDNFLVYKSLLELEKIKKEIEMRLVRFGFTIDNEIMDVRNSNFTNREVTDQQTAIDEFYILKFMIAGAFYPNYYKTGINDEKETMRMLNAKDPKTTVVVTSFKETAIVYHKKIQEIFKICSKNLVLHYEGTKAFVEFKESYEITSKISSGVFFALMLGRLDNPVMVNRVDERQSRSLIRDIDHLKQMLSRKHGLGSMNRLTTANESSTDDVNLLFKNKTQVKIKPVVLTHLSYFWAQIDEDHNITQLQRIEEVLRSPNHRTKRCKKEDLKVGKLVVCLHFTGNGYESGFYRAKITYIDAHKVQVLYVDYGNSEDKDFASLYECPSDLSKIPNQAFRCELAHLRVDPFILESKERSEKALEEYSTLLYSVQNLKATIYSIVDNVVRVVLIDADNPLFEYDLAAKLIKIEIFEKAEESYASKLKHEERVSLKYVDGIEQKDWLTMDGIEKKLDQMRFDKYDTFSISVRSPIQLHLLGMTKCSKFKSIFPDRQSVNRIMLDEEPNLRCTSLVVAHKKAEGEQDRVILRNSCLFPKVKGLPSIVLLAFSPEVEFRYDPQTLKYTGALCGLGYDSDAKKPLLVENDIEEVFEVDFYENDITALNSFRSLVNMMIGSKSSSESALKYPERLKNFQRDSRLAILKLISEKRNLKEEPVHFKKEFRWRQVPEYNLKPLSEMGKKIYESRRKNEIFFMPLRGIDFDKVRQSQRNS